MKTSENLSNIAKALVAVQSEVKGITKNAQGHGYKYITFDAILTLVKPVLSKHGIFLIQNVKGDIVNGENIAYCETRLLHESGEWIESDTLVMKPVAIGKGGQPAPVTPQVVGSALTYAKRYQICGMIGISADVDDDATVASNLKDWGVTINDDQKKIINELITAKALTKAQFSVAMTKAIGSVKEFKKLTSEEATKLIAELSSISDTPADTKASA